MLFLLYTEVVLIMAAYTVTMELGTEICENSTVPLYTQCLPHTYHNHEEQEAIQEFRKQDAVDRNV
jgi:hypothetical protein